MHQTTANKVAIIFVVISTLLGSHPATAGEVEGNAGSRLHASQEAEECDWLATRNFLAHEERWECWEPATGYVRTAISATRAEIYEGNGLQSDLYTVRSCLKVVFSKRESPWSECVGMLDVAPHSFQGPRVSR